MAFPHVIVLLTKVTKSPEFCLHRLQLVAEVSVAFGALPRGMPCCERRVPSLRCLVALFVALNTLNYVDRGIIPGASEESIEASMRSTSGKPLAFR